ncbi:MAG: gliding motility-associated C-terminal domain-containing protein [Bacteroidales bacterium]|nr:gliding motility-associated C-terminal domain-containing protein [Bacteroidales bacterium]
MYKKIIINLFRFLCLICFIFSVSSLRAQGFNITETFKDEKISNITLGGDPFAYLTSGIDDPSGEGWLRLTKDNNYKKGYAIVNQSFPSGLGVLIDLEFKTWRSNVGVSYGGADGFSVFLFDATSEPFHIGAFGGSLGYAQYIVGNESYPGLSGGYFGLGIDEFGNFSNTNEGRIGGTGFKPNTIGVRGPASTNYAWLTGNSDLNFSLQYGVSTSRPSDNIYYRRFQIELLPITDSPNIKYSIKVKTKVAKEGAFITVFGPYELPSAPPALLKLGFAASTGEGVNFHEVRNLYITTPGGVRVTKQVDKIVAKVGDELTYTIDLYNQVDKAVSGLIFNDPLSQLPPGFLIESVSFDNDGNSLNTATGYSKTNLSNVIVALDASSRASFTIKGKINTYPAGGVINNTAIIKVGSSGVIDQDATNDTATVSTNVMVPDYIISQTLDGSCLDTVNGSTLTLKVRNIGISSGAIGSLVTVKDTIPSGLKGESVSGQGWNVSKSSNIYTFTRNDALLAGGSYPDINIIIKPDGTTTNTEWVNRVYVSNDFDIDRVNNVGSPLVLKVLPVAYAGVDQTSYSSGSFTLAGNNPNTNIGIWSVVSGSASVSYRNKYNSTVTLSPDSIATLRWTISNGSCMTYDDVVLTYLVPKIFLIKAVTDTILYKLNDVINYSFTVLNTSAVSLSNVKVADNKLLDMVTYSSGDANNDGILDPGESWAYSGSYIVTKADVDSGKVVNSAIVTAQDPHGDEVSDISGSTITNDDPTIVKIKSDFFIPNVFTPNGDGINDYFEIVGLSAFSNAQLTIFNRWGNVVYYNSAYSNNWDGSGLNGGTYYYLLVLKKESEVERTFNGWVLVKK